MEWEVTVALEALTRMQEGAAASDALVGRTRHATRMEFAGRGLGLLPPSTERRAVLIVSKQCGLAG